MDDTVYESNIYITKLNSRKKNRFSTIPEMKMWPNLLKIKKGLLKIKTLSWWGRVYNCNQISNDHAVWPSHMFIIGTIRNNRNVINVIILNAITMIFWYLINVYIHGNKVLHNLHWHYVVMVCIIVNVWWELSDVACYWLFWDIIIFPMFSWRNFNHMIIKLNELRE